MLYPVLSSAVPICRFAKNLNSDLRRRMQISKHLSNPAHVFSHFASGNFRSLKLEPLEKGIEVCKAMKDFYKCSYSANRMALSVYGQETLDELEHMVRRIYASVPSKHLPETDYDGTSMSNNSVTRTSLGC